jgi:hypothetical protein
MSEDDSWFGLTALQYLELSIGITAGILTIADVVGNNAAVVTWIAETAWSGLFISVKFWHLIAVGAILAGGRYGWLYIRAEDETPDINDALQEVKNRAEKEPDSKDFTSARIKGIDWTWEWKDDEVYGLISLCPECSMQIYPSDVTERIEGAPASVSYPDTIRTVGAEVECDGCSFSHEWEKGSRDLRTFVRKEIKRRARTGEYDI